MSISSGSTIFRESTAQFIRDSLNPLVAVITSYDAELLCQKNNLSVCELLAPLSQLSVDGVIKDPSNQNLVIRGLKLDFRDLRRDGFLTLNALPLALKEMVRSVPASNDKYANCDNTGDSRTGCEVAPWYDQYRKQFTRLLEPSDHEFVRNYVACLLVVSSAHVDPLDQLSRLSQAQHSLQHQTGRSGGSGADHLQLPKHAAPPRWFSSNIFKYHLLIHDVTSEDDKKAESAYQSMKMTYGAHSCHLLRINSSAAPDCGLADPWAGCLRNRLRNFDSVRCTSDASTDQLQDAFEGKENIANDHTAANLMNEGIHSGTGERIPHPLSSTDLQAMVNGLPSDNTANKHGEGNLIRYGRFLSPTDLDRVKIFIQEFCVRGLLPFVERQLRLLNDQVSSRRGIISKSFVNSARRWFSSGSSPNLPSTAVAASVGAALSPSDGPPADGSAFAQRAHHQLATTAPSVTYSPESVEMQMRRLADLAFLFQHYEFAYQYYYSLKKEFTHAGAWLHQAGAAEFASLCVFLAGPSISNSFPSHYIDNALTLYSGVCGKPWLAVRATIFGAEILLSHDSAVFYSEAASQYIRMTAGDDLSGALFLDRASWCFAKAHLFRKAALHLILAGHRYRKCGLTAHTERCYRLADVAYKNRGWKHAEGHVSYALNQHNADDTASEIMDKQAINNYFESLNAYAFSRNFITFMKKSFELMINARKPLIFTPKAGYKYSPKPTTAFDEVANESKAVSKQALAYAINCRPVFTHDFASTNICIIPVGITISNPSLTSSTSIVFRTHANSRRCELRPLAWLRHRRRSFRLAPGQQIKFDAIGYATNAGVYDAATFELADEQSGELIIPSSLVVTVRHV